MPGKFHRKVFCIIEDSSMDVRRIIGNIRKHGGGVERDPFSPIVTHIILPLSQHNVTIVIDRLDSNSHARTVNNIVWTFGYREQDGRQFAPIRSGPMLVDAGWVKAAAMSREYTCRITARLRSPRPQEPRTPPRQPSRMQTGLAARISQSSAPVWPLPNKDRTASPVNTATPDLYSATGTTHDLARRISAPTAPFDLSIARSRVGVSAPTDPASDLPNNRPTREADHAPAPPTQPCLSASYVPRTRLPACTQPEPTMTTAPMVPNFHDKSRDPRLNRSIPTATDNSTSSVLVPPSPTPSHAADTEISTDYLPAVGATDDPRDTPTAEEAHVAAVNPTAGVPITPPLPPSGFPEEGSTSGASGTIRREVPCDTVCEDVQVKAEPDECHIPDPYQPRNEEQDEQHPSKRRRVSEPVAKMSSSRIEGAASPSSLDILDSGSISPRPTPALRRGTSMMPKPDHDGDNGAPNTQTSYRRDTLAEGSHSSGMSVERDLDALSIQRTPVSVLRPGADDIRLSSGATPTRAIKRRATNDGEDQPQEERVDPYIGIRRSLADLGLSVHLAAGHSVSLQILFDIASLPVSHSPEKAFFIVLPLPVDLDASAHVDAITKDLAHMVQRRGMGFAVSYRWLEECFREGRLLSPADWAVRV